MATRKQKRKQRKKKKASQSHTVATVIDLPIEKQVEELKICLKNHRIRRALALAKSLGKHTPISTDILPLIVNAYELRLFEMVNDGHIAEALQLFSLLQSDHPQWNAQFSTDIIVCLECFGAKPQLLLGYERDEKSGKKVDSYIRKHLVDPSVLSNHPLLPESHILRREANVILTVWEKIENDEDLDIRSELSEISRRSPFKYWRVFLHALHDFYHNKDNDAIKTIHRIPEDSALRSLVPVFRDLIARKRPNRGGGECLFNCIYQHDLIYLVDEFEKNLDGSNRKSVQREILSLYDKLKGNHPQIFVLDCISSILLRLEERDYPDPEEVISCLDCNDRIKILLRLDYHLKMDRADDWDAYTKLYRAELSEIELALIYHRQGLLSGYQHPDEDSIYEQSYNKNRRKKLQKNVDYYYQLSIKTHPTETCYEDWIKEHTHFGWETASIHKQWHQDFPENEEVLFCLLQQARKKRAIRQVDCYFEKLKSLLHNSPRILEIAPFIQLERCIHKAKFFPTVQDMENLLADLPNSPKLLSVCKDTLFWLADGCPMDQNHPIVASLEQQQCPYLMFVCLQKIEPARSGAHRRLPPCIKRQFKNADIVVRNVYEAYQVNLTLWFVSTLPEDAQVESALGSRFLNPKLIVEFLAFLRKHCPSLNEMKITELVLQLTANGLKRADVPSADMLCFRAIVYYFFTSEDDETHYGYVVKAKELLIAARHFLDHRSGNEQLFNETAQFIHEYRAGKQDANCSKATISRLLQRETQITSVADLRKQGSGISRFMPNAIKNFINNISQNDFEDIMERFLDEMADVDDVDVVDEIERWLPPKPLKPPKQRTNRKPQNCQGPPEKNAISPAVNLQPELPNLFD